MRWTLVNIIKKTLTLLFFTLVFPWLIVEFTIGLLDAIVNYIRWWDYTKFHQSFISTLYKLFGFKTHTVIIGRNHFRGIDHLNFVILNNKIKCIILDDRNRNDNDLYFVKVIVSSKYDIHLIKIMFDSTISNDSTIW